MVTHVHFFVDTKSQKMGSFWSLKQTCQIFLTLVSDHLACGMKLKQLEQRDCISNRQTIRSKYKCRSRALVLKCLEESLFCL